MHTVAQTGEWFAARGRHKIYAGDRPMELPEPKANLAGQVKHPRPRSAGTSPSTAEICA